MTGNTQLCGDDIAPASDPVLLDEEAGWGARRRPAMEAATNTTALAATATSTVPRNPNAGSNQKPASRVPTTAPVVFMA